VSSEKHVDGPAARIAVALDVEDLEQAVGLARLLSGRVGWLKVGLELFTREGPRAVAAIAEHAPVFLDLKLHDIPTTVARSVASVAALEAGLLTVHASGGGAMLRAAVDAAAQETQGRLRLLAVTVLTSTSDSELAAMGMDEAHLQVPRLARLCVENGIDGLVCAPADIERVRSAVGSSPLVVTPGIRAQASDSDDHARAMSAAEAVSAGADLLVIGRPITRADDPVAAVERIVASLSQADSAP
jgi:orotidine-5'-phosphate decarboxylase